MVLFIVLRLRTCQGDKLPRNRWIGCMAINKKWNMHYFVFIILIIYPSLYYSDLACKINILNDLFFLFRSTLWFREGKSSTEEPSCSHKWDSGVWWWVRPLLWLNQKLEHKKEKQWKQKTNNGWIRWTEAAITRCFQKMSKAHTLNSSSDRLESHKAEQWIEESHYKEMKEERKG